MKVNWEGFRSWKVLFEMEPAPRGISSRTPCHICWKVLFWMLTLPPDSVPETCAPTSNGFPTPLRPVKTLFWTVKGAAMFETSSSDRDPSPW